MQGSAGPGANNQQFVPYETNCFTSRRDFAKVVWGRIQQESQPLSSASLQRIFRSDVERMNLAPQTVIAEANCILSLGISVRARDNDRPMRSQDCKRGVPQNVWVREMFDDVRTEKAVHLTGKRFQSADHFALQSFGCVARSWNADFIGINVKTRSRQLPAAISPGTAKIQYRRTRLQAERFQRLNVR